LLNCLIANEQRHEALLRQGARAMTVSTLLLILLVLALFAAIPAWPHSRSWGYYPSGGIGIVLLIVLIMVFSGRI
jgi:hypothetical protein